jgi:predicted nucleotidyltransferase
MVFSLYPLTKYDFLRELADFHFVEKILLFGSRARGDNQERADIDLAIVCPKASDKDWLKVLDVIENADTLLKIDCLRLEGLSEESELKKNIMMEGKIIYEKNNNEV